MKKEPKDFDSWFIAQYGDRPSDKPLNELLDDWFRANISADAKKNLHKECQTYDACKMVASITLLAKKKNLFKD